MLGVTPGARVTIGSVLDREGDRDAWEGRGSCSLSRDLMRALDGCRDQPPLVLSAKMTGRQVPVMLLTYLPASPTALQLPLLPRLSPRAPPSVNNASCPPSLPARALAASPGLSLSSLLHLTIFASDAPCQSLLDISPTTNFIHAFTPADALHRSFPRRSPPRVTSGTCIRNKHCSLKPCVE